MLGGVSIDTSLNPLEMSRAHVTSDDFWTEVWLSVGRK
jgi:hypothetical protein